MRRATPAKGLATILGLLLCGCIGVIPIPMAKHTPKKFDTRGEIESKDLKFMRSGSSTREGVLFSLGEPDLVWEGERYFGYRWITARGIVVAWAIGDGGGDGGTMAMGKKRHDLVIEFDESGNVTRYADIRKWASTYSAAASRLDLSSPVELSVVYRHAEESKHSGRGTLRLGEDALELVEPNEPNHTIRIRPEDVRGFYFASKRDDRWRAERFPSDLKYVDAEGASRTLGLTMDLTELPTLIDYLRQACPHVAIKS